MWTIETSAGVVLLVGEITNVPQTAPWRPERLEAAATGAQRIILGTKAKVSPGDILRIIFKGGKLTKLPEKGVASDYLDAERLARLRALEARYGQSYDRGNFLMTAFDLLSKRLAFSKDTTEDATDVVRKSARRADIPTRPVGEVRGKDILDNLFAMAPASHLPCLDAAMAAAEIGPDIVTARGTAWTRFDIPAVMGNPLETALGRCWPWTDDSFGSALRGQWIEAIDEALVQPGVTLAVVPVRVLAESDGVLDRLERRGLSVKGPLWRAER
ncbi:TraB/GumN family protein [Sphingomonas koreensis]|uniref:TraB/GumN family protein n=2 Tax=Sphingomonas koreensis TaxID=93064 RepID=A0A430CHF2_9SPHN|nr:TraB/GumN family protein [Sphingomonas koreensis]RSU64392.1 TraB/GumN family protein [Sphingomonas koreensis]RSY78813.1 TraB/GumN family protein [Sphingomonas koreensis]